VSPIESSPNYDPDLETEWIEYDPDSANELLDNMGLTERDDEGFRLRLDGARLEMTITYVDDSPAPSVVEMIWNYWAEIGIRAQPQAVDSSLYWELAKSGDLDVGYWHKVLGSPPGTTPSYFLGTSGFAPWAPAYGEWYSSEGKRGYPPPDWHPIRDVWAAWDKAKSASSEESAAFFMQDLLDVHKENLWMIGIVGNLPVPVVVSTNLHNVPEELIYADEYGQLRIAEPAQFFFVDQ
jgi:peptide/nickel transport system substrate-binding protein